MSQTQLRESSEHVYQATFDEVFDAARLTLERDGYTCAAVDKRLGTFLAMKGLSGFAVELASRGVAQVLSAVPTPPRDAWQLDGPDGLRLQWARLDDGVRAHLEQWREHPEWQYDAARNQLSTLGLRVLLPAEWAHIDLATSRRLMRAQRFRGAHGGLNPTLWLDISRQRPDDDITPMLKEVAGLALSASSRLLLPDELLAHSSTRGFEGSARVLDGTTPRDLTWHVWDARTADWTLRFVAVCGPVDAPEGCDAEWATLVASIDAQGFEFPRQLPGTRTAP